MMALFNAWLEPCLGRFLLGRIPVCRARGLTCAVGLDNTESDYSADQFRRVPRNNPLLIGGYYADVDLAVGRRNS